MKKLTFVDTWRPINCSLKFCFPTRLNIVQPSLPGLSHSAKKADLPQAWTIPHLMWETGFLH